MSDFLTQDDLLFAHAFGRLPEPLALVVATHLALSPEARKRYRHFEAFAGEMLWKSQFEALRTGALESALARLDENHADLDLKSAEDLGDDPVPSPLREVLGGPLDGLRWKRFGSFAEHRIEIGRGDYRASLVRVKSGRRTPRHTHRGLEVMLVLRGGLHDERGHYSCGEMMIANEMVDHQPAADPGEDCLCLSVINAPLRLTGPFLRLLNPLLPG